MKKLVIIGASGHGKVIADIAIKNGYENIVFLDDNKEIKECSGFPVVGTTDEADRFECDKIVAIGDAQTRQSIQNNLNRVVSLIHPSAVISRRVIVGDGTVIMAGAVINSDTTIGRGCIINTGASVDHDSQLEDFVHVSVGAHIAGTVHIKQKTWIGAGAIVLNNLTICENTTIGAGAVVIRDVLQQGVYVGVPAKRLSR